MQQIRLMCVAAGLMISGTALAQAPAAPVGPSGPAGEVQRGYAAQKGNILKAADKMPESDYQFKPTPEVRTYARVVNHVTEAQLRTCGAVNRTAASDLAKVPAETADKAAIVEALKASFAECDKAFAAVTDANLGDMFEVFNAKRSRIGIMWGTVSHDNEQYATLALYLRLKGLVPPSSEK
ncbi:DinB family protein [Tunturiibacter gelidiferens]|uniref:DinB family protein n=1 Tax=Tunturiibacter gelidiferens TaxID=3069689 RepID=UPI003D9B389B